MFEIDDSKYPKTWKEASLDFKLFFVFHLCIMALFATSGRFPISSQVRIVAVAACVLTAIATVHRFQNKWHWPGCGIKNVFAALVSLALGLFFLGADTPRTSSLNPRFFPAFVAGAGIILFWVLFFLKIVNFSEKEFLRHCGDKAPEEPHAGSMPQDPQWKRTVRTLFVLYSLAAWILGVSFFWKFNIAFSKGAPKPTRTQTEKLVDHGKRVYVTPEEKRAVSLLEYALMLGGPSVFLIGFLLHFVAGVKLLPNTPTLAEIRAKGVERIRM